MLKLKGPAFWLAYEIAFLRRWANPKDAMPGKGKKLLESLEKHGYCAKAASRTGDRVSYKAALREWFSDVDKLVDINVLEAPGVNVYEVSKGKYKDVTEVIKALLENRGKRITQTSLCDMKVLYRIPEQRVAELAGTRARRETLRAAHHRTPKAAIDHPTKKGKSPTKKG